MNGTFKSHWNLFLVIISRLEIAPFCHNISSKFWSEQKSTWWPWHLLLGIAQSHTMKSLAHLVLGLFGQDYDISLRLGCHYKGIPCKKLGKPPEIAIFGRFHLIMCILITKLNVTIPVLFKTSFKYRFHPTCTPYPTPLGPPPLSNPSCPHPLAPVLQPLPQEFGPPAKSKSVIKNS